MTITTPRGSDGSRSERGQSEPIGVILLLAITIIGTGVVISAGSIAVSNERQASRVAAVEHAMTQFDSQAAIVALGQSDRQSITLTGDGSGTVRVEDSAGWLRIEHRNFSGDGADELMYNRSFGAVRYRYQGVEVAYQGGGVWRLQDNHSIMLSPPEVHYRAATLTLPIIRVTGTDAIAGGTTATILAPTSARPVYPNRSASADGVNEIGAPYNGSEAPYRNPTANGTIVLTIHSRYYQGWADYFRARTDGAVSVRHSNRTVAVELISTGDLGEFEMPASGGSLDLYGFADHSLSTFSITLIADAEDSADFSNLKWSMYVDEGPDELEYTLRTPSGNDCGDPVALHVYFSDDEGSTFDGWTNDSAFEIECGDFDADGNTGDKRIVANFTSPTDLTASSSIDGSDKVLYFAPVSGTYNDPTTFDGHIDWEPKSYAEGNEESIRNLSKHYFSEVGPNFELTVEDFSGDSISEEESTGVIENDDGSASTITYLHVTKNTIRVDLD